MILSPGLSTSVSQLVDHSISAKTMGSGTLDVLATPAMIALMEKAAWTCVSEFLIPGTGTVGTKMDVKHLSATPIGMEITCTATLLEVDNRKLLFRVSAVDSSGPIGEGVHERFIIDERTFLEKTNKKTGLSEISPSPMTKN